MTIVTYLLRNKCYQSIRAKHKINYNTITTLLGAYVYTTYIKSEFTLTGLFRFISYYNYKSIKRYVYVMIECNLITQAGAKKYKLTNLGLSAIKEIEDNYKPVLFNFCQKYNVVL